MLDYNLKEKKHIPFVRFLHICKFFIQRLVSVLFLTKVPES